MKRLVIVSFSALSVFFACTEKAPEVPEKEVRVGSVSVSPSSKELGIGETIQLSTQVFPSTAAKKDITWSSSKESVASVSSSGLVTAIGEGTSTITASADGKKGECHITVSKPTYTAPILQEAQVTDKFMAWDEWNATYIVKPWYDALSSEQKTFIYPHLLVSYVVGQWYKVDNLEYIIEGEVPTVVKCENVGRAVSSDFKTHADSGYKRIKSLAPTASIKASGGNWTYLKDYVVQHPEKLFMISCAAHKLGGKTKEILTSDEQYKCLKGLLGYQNMVFSIAVGNMDTNPGGDWITLNESVIVTEPKEGQFYNSSSVNGGLNNKYTVSGYYLKEENVFGGNNHSCYALGFDNQKNFVVPMTELYNTNGEQIFEANGTASSFPTAAFSATLGNFLSILLRTHPGITLEGASTIMQENYFQAETMKYKDLDGTVKTGEHWHFFKTDDFIADEILQKSAVDAAFSGSAQVIELPSSGGLCYMGPGIQFVVDGTTYEMVEQNRSTLVSALSGNKDIKWTFSREQADKYATGSISITIRIIDHAGELIPDIKRTIAIAL